VIPRPFAAARRSALCVVLGATLLAACADQPKPYHKPPVTDPVRQKAEMACANNATVETQNMSPPSTASKAAVGIYWKCMAEKGYPPPQQQQR
jgi:hypothetical protein